MRHLKNPQLARSAVRGILGMILVSLVGLSVLALSLSTLIPEETLSGWTTEVTAAR